MQIEAENVGDDVSVVGLKGKLDTATVASVEKELLGLINGGTRLLVLDLAALDYISSAGLRVLLVAAKALRAHQGRLVVCAVKRYVKEVLDMSGFSSVFPICESREEALAGAKSDAS